VLLWLKDFEIRIPYLGGLNCSIREVIWLLIAKCSLHFGGGRRENLGEGKWNFNKKVLLLTFCPDYYYCVDHCGYVK
jgi:hypothetical protein